MIIMITLSRLVVDGQGQQLAPPCQNVETGWPVIPHHHHDDNGNDNDDEKPQVAGKTNGLSVKPISIVDQAQQQHWTVTSTTYICVVYCGVYHCFFLLYDGIGPGTSTGLQPVQHMYGPGHRHAKSVQTSTSALFGFQRLAQKTRKSDNIIKCDKTA